MWRALVGGGFGDAAGDPAGSLHRPTQPLRRTTNRIPSEALCASVTHGAGTDARKQDPLPYSGGGDRCRLAGTP